MYLKKYEKIGNRAKEKQNLHKERRTRSRYDVSIFRQTRDETIELTEQINKIEKEIDERVAELYGVKLESL
jgi:hypothetical protein